MSEDKGFASMTITFILQIWEWRLTVLSLKKKHQDIWEEVKFVLGGLKKKEFQVFGFIDGKGIPNIF